MQGASRAATLAYAPMTRNLSPAQSIATPRTSEDARAYNRVERHLSNRADLGPKHLIHFVGFGEGSFPVVTIFSRYAPSFPITISALI